MQNHPNPPTPYPQHHYPFGMMMADRTWSSESGYRFGFNGKEIGNEAYGDGNIYDYGFRIYNPRLGKFLSVDPLTSEFPWYTPYQFAGNKPVIAIDLDGLEEKIQITLSFKLLEGKPTLEPQVFKDAFLRQGPLGNGTLYVDVQFIENQDGSFAVTSTLSYAEPDETGQLNNFQLIKYSETTAEDETQAKLYRSFFKNYRGYYKNDVEYKGRFQDWKDKNFDPTVLEELVKVFGMPQANWQMEDFDNGEKKLSRDKVYRDRTSFIPGDDTTYTIDSNGDTTKYRINGKEGSRSRDAFMEYNYTPKKDD